MERYGQIYEAKNEPPVSTLYHNENLIIASQYNIYYFFPLHTDCVANQHNIVYSFKEPFKCKVSILSICDSLQVNHVLA